MANRGGTTSSTTGNAVSGQVAGSVVQAGSIGSVHLHEAVPVVVVPRQLPPATRGFAGRRFEVDHLGRWLDDDGSLCVVISGAGGVGKTTLALRWLHDVRDSFPDGQLYLDLDAFSSTGPVRSEEALECFLLALGVAADRVPPDLAGRTALFRSITAELSLVVLLDNATSAAQVRPLLPASPTCAAVVTSRWRLVGLGMEGARFLELEPMETDASLELLAKAVGETRLSDERGAARELTTLCGGLPLALSVVAARLSAHPRRSLSREAGDLRAEQDRFPGLELGADVSVEAVLDLSYRELTSGQAAVYRTCALHPGPEFGTEVVTDALGESSTTALAALVEANLLVEVDEHRFRYHDLLRLHALRKAEKETLAGERRELSSTMVRWYLDTLVAADALLRPTRRRVGPRFEAPADRTGLFGSQREALRWFDVERANLRQACVLSVDLGLDDLAWQFCEAMWSGFLHTRHYDDWFACHDVGVAASVRSVNRAAEAQLRLQLSFAFSELKRFDEASAQGTAALKIVEESGDRGTAAAVLNQLAGIAQAGGDLATALSLLHRVREIRQEVGTPRALAFCGRRIGQVLADQGHYPEAERELVAAVDAMTRLGDQVQQAWSLVALGKTYLRWGRAEQAAETLRPALEIMRLMGTPYYEAEVLTALGEVAVALGDLPAARRHYSGALERYVQVEEPKAIDLRARLDAVTEVPSQVARDSRT
ncbi:tetratricopeptide repeat protein [Umezawaea endophytica]|uniref:Tetratricopeptide repeat protein n=1 Tax=Umezawaea endophytica TaxID=1654476 RepID=A0A9X2VW31_9PSEU|nr:tetratricopeptide repeat protein [Umezawaea endophytica]MCS7483262.1 tetratricopeptide repeat protein [Umezawaea endophytica]